MSLLLKGWQTPDRGALFVVTGASGTGKTTLVKKALNTIPDLCFSVSATTRLPRTGEEDGVDYHFLSQEAFQNAINNNQFLEWAEVYGNRYGTLREPVEAALVRGQSILLEIDQQGAAQVRHQTQEGIFVFILPPSIQALEDRLRHRKTDSEAIIQRRIQDAKEQLQHCGSFQYLLINDDLESAHDQFQGILISELLRRSRRDSWVHIFAGPHPTKA